MMTAIDTSTTLGDLVNTHPSLARELERLGLDYCCGGTRTLADACAANGLDGRTVAADLAAAAGDEPPADWASLNAAELVDHLVGTHHGYLWSEMPRLSALLEKVDSVHGDRHSELRGVRQTFETIRLDMEPHLQKEERILFPMIRELARSASAPEFHCGTLANPVSVMLREHDRVGELLEELRRQTNGYTVPDDGCASYRACYAGLELLESDTHLHVHKENNLLFPMVLRLEQDRTAP